jgi:methylated-DNA-[protein]-cysteine S-methyltransferase
VSGVPRAAAPEQQALPLDVSAPVPSPAVAFGTPLAGAPVLYTTHAAPVGELLLVGDGASLTGVYFNLGPHRGTRVGTDWRRLAEPFAAVRRQLDAYFAGELRAFDLPLAPRGTAFQLAVWRELTTIGYGTTVSYGSIAQRLGDAGASRAVGLANGRNPISIIVPCHRVIGADGSLTGYGGGLDRKRFLLRLERGHPAR